MKDSHTILLHRKRNALTQGELAQLLGVSQSVLSRIEDGLAADLRLDVALALTVVFGLGPHRMFDARYQRIEDEVMNRAAELHQRIHGGKDRKAAKKQSLLDDMMRRATANHREV